MGVYAEYLNSGMNFAQLTEERKRVLALISTIRGNRDILVIAADISKNDSRIQIDYTDILPVQDQLANLSGKEIDIILETPGGFAEVAEDIVKLIRGRYEKVGMIVPGWAKSAGTIFSMAGDEILLGLTSSLGPIDAQIMLPGGKRFSADAFLDGLKKIKEEVEQTGKLNAAYIPILQNISPGEIQHCEHAQNFSKQLVTQWLEKYKFKYWTVHSKNNQAVSQEERHSKAEEIATELCSQSRWLTHGRSIKLDDLESLGLKITDYSKNAKLNDAITRYYTLLRMTFEATNMYKLFETTKSQIHRFFVPLMPPQPPSAPPPTADVAVFDFKCLKCGKTFKIQANLGKDVPLQSGAYPYPKSNDVFICPVCGTQHNLSDARLQIEAQSGKKVVH